jgi:hypothetical protein
MQFELNTEYLDRLKDLIAHQQSDLIKTELEELYPVDIALILNQLVVEDANYIYDLLDEEQSADVLLEMEEEKREALLATFSTKEIADMLGLDKSWFTEEEFKQATTAPRSNCVMNTDKLQSVYPIQSIDDALRTAIENLKTNDV